MRNTNLIFTRMFAHIKLSVVRELKQIQKQGHALAGTKQIPLMDIATTNNLMEILSLWRQI